MVLSNETRGAIEKAIDNAVVEAQMYVRVLFDPKNRHELQIKEANDFVLGVSLGTLTQRCQYIFIALIGRTPNIEELIEIGAIIYRGLPRIRDAMFKAG